MDLETWCFAENRDDQVLDCITVCFFLSFFTQSVFLSKAWPQLQSKNSASKGRQAASEWDRKEIIFTDNLTNRKLF